MGITSGLGWIKFNFHDIETPPRKQKLDYSGKLCRIIPEFQREPPSPETVQALLKKLLQWEEKVSNGVKTIDNLSSVASVTLTCILYTLPNVPETSLELETSVKFLFHLWIFDCLVEELKADKTDFRQLHKIVKIFEAQLLTGKTPDLVADEIQLEPKLKALIDMNEDIVILASKIGMVSHSNWNFFVSKWIEWYNLGVTYVVHPMHDNVAFRTFTWFRSGLACTLGLTTINFILGEGKKSHLKEEVYTHPAFKKVADSANFIINAGNDLLGVKRDVLEGDMDSHVMFLAESEGIPVAKAGEKVTKLINEEVKDYFLMKGVITKIFPEDEGLKTYLKYVDWYIAGGYKTYLEDRYGVKGCFELC